MYTVQHRALQTSSSHLFNYHIIVIFITLNVIIVAFRIGPEEVCVCQHITRLPQSVAFFQAGEKKMDSLIHLLKHMLTEHVHSARGCSRPWREAVNRAPLSGSTLARGRDRQ